MKYQLQTIMGYNPEQGIYGDCYRTCIAVLLDMDAADVPHFVYDSIMAGKDGWYTNECVKVWLEQRGMTMLTTTFIDNGGNAAIDCLRFATGGFPFVLTMKSPRYDVCHSVVAKVGEYGLEVLWCPTVGGPVKPQPFYCKDNDANCYTADVIMCIPESLK